MMKNRRKSYKINLNKLIYYKYQKKSFRKISTKKKFKLYIMKYLIKAAN